MTKNKKDLSIRGLRFTQAGLHIEMDRSGEHASISEPIVLSQGEITVILGANGVGKTRLMEISAGLREPSGLAIQFGAEEMWTSSSRSGSTSLKRNQQALLAYSYSCQSPEEQLFARSVRDELQYTLRPYGLHETERHERMATALAAVGWDKAWLTRDPYFMSGGERRRTALACLFAPPAAWLLLDEPTAGLDADGQAQLSEQLKRAAAQGQGVLLISHESDWALQLASRILLMKQDGSAVLCTREALLAEPDLLAQAGMDVPDWLRIAHLLQRKYVGNGNGDDIPSDAFWSPAELARALPSQKAHTPAPTSTSPTAQTSPAQQQPTSRTPFQARATDQKPSPLTKFDPRSVWLTYILLSAAILTQSTWLGVAIMSILTAVCIYFGRFPLKRWKGAILALAFFTLTLSVFAGVGPNGHGGYFSLSSFLVSLQSLIRPFIAMLLGFGLPLAITPLRLRRSLEQLLGIFGKVPLWGTKMILIVTLLLRFIPVLLSEWERFGRVTMARGKQIRRSGRSAIRQMRETAVPFMLALFRLGEQVSDALESRGVGVNQQPTLLVTEKWKAIDTLLVICGAAILLLIRK
ncbi:energy-coupling factor transport system ATP-binding protein [Paenibacillus taihuensis]|uniref:Energy-coupling factor transport system ATP-binding protein n=1 Tax=Paenibacillus taihuensis TaxID=1156355 RepID=A0A3D9RVR3_9BACL|nr:ATP-binding cassette domain-containing protein [Paenibacillus taihuensis]REE81176.1 energy-coupling factor transport system ATP-binding protein [Paenibacillus taihuensis]